MVAAIKTATETLEAEAKPLIVVAESISYNEDDSGATATNLTSPGIPRLVMIAGLTFAKGSVLTDSNLAFFTPIGAILGFIAAAKVHESIGWVERFNLAASGHATGKDVDVQPEKGYRLAFQQKGYLVLTTYTGISGVFVAVSNTAAAPTSDFARIENVRTMDKAARNLRTLLLPKINSPLYVEANGKLDRATIEVFKALGIQALDSLLVAGEISAYVIDVDPDQNVLTSGVLQIGVRIVPVGSAEQITANLSYTLSIA
jgi:hypothetical protein